MSVVSVNVGLPREVIWRGRTVRTGIFKEPVAGVVRVRARHMEGDYQADLRVHGGWSKAVYAYPSEHYGRWRKELAGQPLPWGMFGENLTTHGLREDEVHIGDRFRIGSAEVRVTEPRLPCYKLGIKFGRPDIIKRFLKSGRSGFYLAVEREGELCAGEAIEPIGRDGHGITVSDIVRLSTAPGQDPELLRRAAALDALPEGWRRHFRRLLTEGAGGPKGG